MGRMRRIAAADLLLLPVRLHGIALGRPVDLLLDPNAERAVGLEVLARDEQHRFLPLAGAEVHRDEILLRSALVLLDEGELAFYRRRGHTIRALRGARVEQAGEPVGVLRDVAIGLGGEVTELLVETDGAERWVAAAGLQVVAPVPTR
jgi:hypothetical protein